MIIYKLTNKVNKKVYVGQTRQRLSLRLYQHSITDSLIGRTIRKHGIENFEVETLHQTDCQDTLNLLEKTEIQNLSALIPNGYNIHHGGNSPNSEHKHTEEFIEYVRAINTGKKQSEELVKKRMLKIRGQHRSVEQKDNIKLAQPHRKTIRCINTGVVYNSIQEAAKDLNLSDGNIGQILKGNRKQTNGYRFEVVNDAE